MSQTKVLLRDVDISKKLVYWIAIMGLLAASTGCSSNEQPKPVNSKLTAPVSTISQPPSPQPEDLFQNAIDTAIGATTIAQSAQSPDDWKLITYQLQKAIEQLRLVPKSNPNYAEAQKKIKEYQRNLAVAKTNINNPVQTNISTATTTETTQQSTVRPVNSKSLALSRPSLTATSTGTKARNPQKKISGRQYVTLNKGPQAVGDNNISLIPCEPINKGCSTIHKKLLGYFSQVASTWSSINLCRNSSLMGLEKSMCSFSNMNRLLAITDRQINGYMPLLNSFSRQKGHTSTRTDFEGSYTIGCPTAKCLIFSEAGIATSKYYWISIVKAGEKKDLSNSSALKAVGSGG